MKNNLAHRHRPTGLVNYSQDDVGQLLHDLTTLRAASTRMPVSVIFRIRVVSIAPASSSNRSFLATTSGLDEVNQNVSRDVLGREDSLAAALLEGNQFKRPAPKAREALVSRPLRALCQAFANASMAASRVGS